jgi:hypothetical protein
MAPIQLAEAGSVCCVLALGDSYTALGDNYTGFQ